MVIHCQTCGAVVAAQDINLERMLAKCAGCNSVFGISAPIERAAGASEFSPPRRRLIAQPGTIRIVEDEGEERMATYRTAGTVIPRLVVERRWFTPMAWVLAVAVIALEMVVAFAFAISFEWGRGAPDPRFTIQDGFLFVVHGPLPWPGRSAIPVDLVRQLFCQQIGNRSYRLTALLTNGKKAMLLNWLAEPDCALYLEELLERRLGIPDEPVAGEFV
jgi:hypothetical protein